ncbi:SAS3 [Sanghuangporus sanghuang]
MRSLPFPAEAAYNREQSLDFTSPGPGTVLNGVPPLADVVPLDPALGGPSSAPPYFPHVNGVKGINGHEIQQRDSTLQPYPVSPTYAFGQYPQGPEGDPFAPPPHFFPGSSIGNAPDGAGAMPQKPVRRSKRKPRREEECGFCGGDNAKNKAGVPERMVTCTDCGRSGHPTCMDLGSIGEVLHSYPWKCNECKTCEICNEKGDDERILFCDNCDRGWHMYCLDPPLDENPEGSWFCPQCHHKVQSTPTAMDQEAQEPPIAPELQIDPALQMQAETSMEIDPALRGESVASTAPSEPQPTPRRRPKGRPKSRKSERVRDRKGKGRALILSDEDEEEEVEIEALMEEDQKEAQEEEEDGDEEEMYPVASTPKGRAPLNNRRKSSARMRRTSESVPDDIERPSPPPRPPKKMRLTVHSPSPPPRQRHPGPGRPKMVVKLRLPGKGKGREDEDEEEPKKSIFDDFLDERECDTSKTSILSSDKERFEKARVVAESKLLPQPTIEPIDLSAIPGPSNGRFPLRSAVHQLQQQQTQARISVSSSMSPTPSTPGPPHNSTKYDASVLRIRTIRFGPYDIQTWYDAPFPEEFSNIPDGRLWICEFCLKYMKSRFGAQRHRLKCKSRHPPGDEIYRDGSISIFEVDGRKNKIYCQNLCLLSKMFLDHKSLFYDVEPFLFYVMTEVDDVGARFVGYFSKEKRSSKDLNLSCIMTLPVRQRQGWGNLLIDFSYLLSRKEHKCGTPERPLSALGAIGYKKYWTLAIMRYLSNAPSNPRLEDISTTTGMTMEDIYVTFMQQGMITVHEGSSSPVRPSPGRSVKINRNRKSGLARRNLQKAQPADEEKASKGPFVPPTNYDVYWDPDDVRQWMADWTSKGYLTLKPDKLKWTPFLLSRADKLVTPLEDALTIAPIDVENTQTPTTPTPGPVLAEAPATTTPSPAPLEVTAEATEVDVAASPVVAATAASDSGREAVGDSHIHATLAEGRAPPSESEERTSEPESSPTPSPSPASPSFPSGLEALAAVAFAVSKANPVDVRKRSTSTILPPDIDTPKPAWARNGLNGMASNPVSPVRSLQPVRNSPITPPLETRSRRLAAKTEDVSVPLHRVVVSPANRPADSQLDERQSVVPGNNGMNGLSPTSPSSERVSVEQDAELAARLAREESVQRRSLRSSSKEVLSIPSLSARESRPRESVRKRQKAPSIRELSPPTPISPDRPTTRRQAQVMAIESAKSGRMTRRQSSRLAANGGDVETLSISGTPLKRSTRLNSASKPAIPQPPAKSARNQVASSQRNKSRKSRTTRSRRAQSPSEQSTVPERVEDEEEDIDAEGEPDVDAEGEVEVPDSSQDVSMGEQDMIIVDHGVKLGVNGMSGVESGQVNGEDQAVTPTIADGHGADSVDAAPPLSAGLTHDTLSASTAPDSPMKVDVVIEEDDIDAEGEPDDEDADGEPDPDIFS